MSDRESQFGDSSHDGIQVDAYGVKARLKPTAPDEPEPKTVKELLSSIRRNLLAAVHHVFGITTEALRSTRRLVRGVGDVGGMPSAVVSRVEPAHARVDAREAEEQAKLDRPGSPPVLPSVVEQGLVETLQRLQSKGIPVELREVRPGVFVVLMVQPELRDTALRLVGEELALPAEVAESSEYDGEERRAVRRFPASGDVLVRRVTHGDKGATIGADSILRCVDVSGCGLRGIAKPREDVVELGARVVVVGVSQDDTPSSSIADALLRRAQFRKGTVVRLHGAASEDEVRKLNLWRPEIEEVDVALAFD